MRSITILIFFCALWSASYGATFQPTLSTYPFNIGANVVRTGFFDETYGYFGCDDAIVKVRMDSQEIEKILYLTGSDKSILTSVKDGNIGYFGTETDPGIIIKVK